MSDSCSKTEKPKSIREFFTSSYFWKPFAGVVVGIIGGYLYYHFIGCTSNSCAITSNPYMSSLAGGLLGLFVVNNPCIRRCA